MSIIYNKVIDNFSIVTNLVLRNKELSWKAKGIYAYLCGCESGFNITQEGLAAFGNCGVVAVASGIEELEALGLVEIEQTNDGKFGNNKWTINTDIAVPRFCGNGKPDNGKPSTNKSIDNKNNNNNSASPLVSADAPVVLELPKHEKIDPAVEKALKAEFNRSKKRAKTRLSKSFPADFAAVYDNWPKTCDKIAAYGAWSAIVEEGIDPNIIIDAAKIEAENGRYCQNLLQWLQNGGYLKNRNAHCRVKESQNNRFDASGAPTLAKNNQKPALECIGGPKNESLASEQRQRMFNVPQWLVRDLIKLGIDAEEADELNSNWSKYQSWGRTAGASSKDFLQKVKNNLQNRLTSVPNELIFNANRCETI